ncbi:hypothetical protein FISHEDRAFT_74966 [Fistulina hepatica ATCC 64428]|uniref:Uncharacterized protein n=1 Tax=Fistulina hepatica ATCC 64428 TaxID=1128425 RepID=A0A0D7A7Z8_9AGAR|nr:hypothetical protein FISHEDRAFT_74966 [Fistulina hepatica ATCC 64428]
MSDIPPANVNIAGTAQYLPDHPCRACARCAAFYAGPVRYFLDDVPSMELLNPLHVSFSLLIPLSPKSLDLFIQDPRPGWTVTDACAACDAPWFEHESEPAIRSDAPAASTAGTTSELRLTSRTPVVSSAHVVSLPSPSTVSTSATQSVFPRRINSESVPRSDTIARWNQSAEAHRPANTMTSLATRVTHQQRNMYPEAQAQAEGVVLRGRGSRGGRGGGGRGAGRMTSSSCVPPVTVIYPATVSIGILPQAMVAAPDLVLSCDILACLSLPLLKLNNLFARLRSVGLVADVEITVESVDADGLLYDHFTRVLADFAGDQGLQYSRSAQVNTDQPSWVVLEAGYNCDGIVSLRWAFRWDERNHWTPFNVFNYGTDKLPQLAKYFLLVGSRTDLMLRSGHACLGRRVLFGYRTTSFNETEGQLPPGHLLGVCPENESIFNDRGQFVLPDGGPSFATPPVSVDDEDEEELVAMLTIAAEESRRTYARDEERRAFPGEAEAGRSGTSAGGSASASRSGLADDGIPSYWHHIHIGLDPLPPLSPQLGSRVISSPTELPPSLQPQLAPPPSQIWSPLPPQQNSASSRPTSTDTASIPPMQHDPPTFVRERIRTYAGYEHTTIKDVAEMLWDQVSKYPDLERALKLSPLFNVDLVDPPGTVEDVGNVLQAFLLNLFQKERHNEPLPSEPFILDRFRVDWMPQDSLMFGLDVHVERASGIGIAKLVLLDRINTNLSNNTFWHMDCDQRAILRLSNASANEELPDWHYDRIKVTGLLITLYFRHSGLLPSGFSAVLFQAILHGASSTHNLPWLRVVAPSAYAVLSHWPAARARAGFSFTEALDLNNYLLAEETKTRLQWLVDTLEMTSQVLDGLSEPEFTSLSYRLFNYILFDAPLKHTGSLDDLPQMQVLIAGLNVVVPCIPGARAITPRGIRTFLEAFGVHSLEVIENACSLIPRSAHHVLTQVAWNPPTRDCNAPNPAETAMLEQAAHRVQEAFTAYLEGVGHVDHPDVCTFLSAYEDVAQAYEPLDAHDPDPDIQEKLSQRRLLRSFMFIRAATAGDQIPSTGITIYFRSAPRAGPMQRGSFVQAATCFNSLTFALHPAFIELSQDQVRFDAWIHTTLYVMSRNRGPEFNDI